MARTDEVFANGITINSGAMIALSGQTQGRLATGLTLTLISNTRPTSSAARSAICPMAAS